MIFWARYLGALMVRQAQGLRRDLGWKENDHGQRGFGKVEQETCSTLGCCAPEPKAYRGVAPEARTSLQGGFIPPPPNPSLQATSTFSSPPLPTWLLPLGTSSLTAPPNSI